MTTLFNIVQLGYAPGEACRSACVRGTCLLLASVLGLATGAALRADDGFVREVAFSLTVDVGFGNTVYVIGDAFALGEGDVTRGLPLVWHPGNVWSARAVVPRGREVSYRFWNRPNSAAATCDPLVGTPLGDVVSLPAEALPEGRRRDKTVLARLPWPQAELLARDPDGEWRSRPMVPQGEPDDGEQLFRLDLPDRAGEALEFVFHNGSGSYVNAPYPGFGANNFQTSLDVFLMQGGRIYSRWPASDEAAATIESFTVTAATAPADGGALLPSRTVRVWLPPGYAAQPTRRYPIVVLQDGQNVFAPGGPFGSWDAEVSAGIEMEQGRVQEAILVAVENRNRFVEYMPDGSTLEEGGDTWTGRAGAYAAYLVGDVLPEVRRRYRTAEDPAATVLIGSSLGGVITLWLGWETEAFGRLGVMSPSFWAIPDYLGTIAARPAPGGRRVYVDWGTEEGGGAGGWGAFLDGYDLLTARGLPIGRDLWRVIGCGEGHNEAAWRRRLPEALRFLLPAVEAPNALEAELFPPLARVEVDEAGEAWLVAPGRRGWQSRVERSTDLREWAEELTLSTGDPFAFTKVKLAAEGDGGESFRRVTWVGR